MAIVAGTDATKTNIQDEVDAEVNTEAETATVWFPGSTPTFIDLTKVGVLDNPLTSLLAASDVEAAEIVDLIADNALQSTRFRLAHAGLIGGVDHGIQVTSLTAVFELPFAEFGTIGPDFSIQAGEDVTAAGLNSAITSISDLLVTHRITSSVIELQICHSSCHVNCHSSRGRR